MRIVLISTYDLGHQPFGLASPAAWLRGEGHHVTCADLACGPLPGNAIREADLIAFYLPMHTATRLALKVIPRVRAANSEAHLCAYGLYAPVNASYLRELGVATILGGEFERELTALAARLQNGVNGAQQEPLISLEALRFRVPDRSGMAPLSAYAQLVINGVRKPAGYTEASRGCKHLCRHCPIVPVYDGRFRIVQREVVLEDIRRQVAAGAQHITFGDPDFLNGPGHAIPLVEALCSEFPRLTYDVTIKVEHLLRHRALLPVLRRTGCLFVTSAVESLDDRVLEKLQKGHTRADFFELVNVMRDADLPLAPTFVPFTPWTTRESYQDVLRAIGDLGLVPNVAPIQLAIRLLIPAGSRLLELDDIRDSILPFDPQKLVYPWRHEDAEMDRLSAELQQLIQQNRNRERAEIFSLISRLASGDAHPAPRAPAEGAGVPYLTEPWYCCAEPTEDQAALV